MFTSSSRIFTISLVTAGVALALLVGLSIWAFNPASLKPRLIADIERATGRTAGIAGAVSVGLSLQPTLTIENLTLANPTADGARFSRPEMIRVARVDLSLSLLPLLLRRFEISHIALVRPDIVLETDPAGRRNWVFHHGVSPAAGDTSATGTAGSRSTEPVQYPLTVGFQDIEVTDGRIGWIDGAAGHHLSATVPLLTVTTTAAGGTKTAGTMLADGHTIAISAQSGPPEGSPGAWPIDLLFDSDGATLRASGHFIQPDQGRGYQFGVDVDMPDPKNFASFWPRGPLETMSGVKAHADIHAGEGSTPAVDALSVKATSIDLGALVPGVHLTGADISARGDEPVQLSTGVIGPGLEAGLTGTIGAPRLLSTGTLGAVTLDLSWNAASARGSVTGTVESLLTFSGYTIDLAADIPRPSAVLGRAPPTLKAVSLRAHLTDGTGPVRFQASASAGDLTGDFTVARAPKLTVTGTLSSDRLDLDALRPGPADASPRAGGPPAPAASSTAEGATRPPDADRARPLLGHDTLPFDRLREADADVTFRLGSVRVAETNLTGVAGTLSLHGGKLRVTSSATSGQPMTAELTADASATPPSEHLTVDAPAMPLRLLLAALNLPPLATGAASVHANLSSVGDTAHGIAAALNGPARIAAEGGQVDTRAVNDWLGELKPLRIAGGDATDLRCLAIRADAASGIVSVDPLVLNTPMLILEGSGDIDLGKETLSLRLRPRTKIGGTGIALPLRVAGPMRAPSAKADISPGNGGPLAGLLLGGKDIMGAAGGGDPCPDALVRARENVGG